MDSIVYIDKENCDILQLPTVGFDQGNNDKATSSTVALSAQVEELQITEEEGENFLVNNKRNNSNPNNKGEMIYIGNNPSTNLQSSFLKFREQKLKERNIMKLCQQIDSTNQQRSDEFKMMLRTKFIERAKAYLGVPYARRFEDPKLVPEEAPLYLDCCALVRKAVQDLSTEFGFIIGRWNQCYQMDTLPIVLDSIEQCKPGDLIFYEGIYNSKRSKPQKHNNVHVEIYLGGEFGPESTIASRFHKGKVSIFPSYKFTSTTWSLVKHHFRSLDTWLNGVCKSCCPDHMWQSDSLAYLEAAGKRSIFSVEDEDSNGNRTTATDQEDEDVRADNDNGEDEEEDDIEGGGGEGEDDNEELKEEMKTISPKPALLDPLFPLQIHSSTATAMDNYSPTRNASKSVNDADGLLPDPLLFNKESSFASMKAEEKKEEQKISFAESKSTSNKNPPRNRRVLSKSLDNDEFNNGATTSGKLEKNNSNLSLGVSNSNSNEGGTVSQKAILPRPKRISKYNSAPASSALTTGNSNSYHSDSEYHPSSMKSNNSGPSTSTRFNKLEKIEINGQLIPVSKTYYCCRSNGWRLYKAALDKRGFHQLPQETNSNNNTPVKYGFKYVERRSQIDYKAHQSGQIVCHIINNDIITTKIGLLTILRDKFCSKALSLQQRKPFPPWLPLTFDLESPTDIHSLFDYMDKEKDKDNIIWIYKPSCYNRGRGIKIVSGVESLQLICYGSGGVGGNNNGGTGGKSSSKVGGNNSGPPSSANEGGYQPPLKGIIQKYIMNPLLIGKEGYKFDIRCYLLVARNFPTTFAFYHPGYCRLALKPYSLSATTKEELNDPYMHLTNASIQKTAGDMYYDNKDIQIQSVKGVAEQMLSIGKESNGHYILNTLDHEIKLCMVDIMKACNSKLMKKHGYFDLFGCDFMITDDNKLCLLEINTNPALSLDNKVLEELLPNVVDGAVDLVLRTQGPDVHDLNNVRFTPNDDSLPSKYELIYDEKNNWMYT